MGPGCQYRNIAPDSNGTSHYNVSSDDVSLAIDSNITTCSKIYDADKQAPWWGLHFPRVYYIVGLNIRINGENTVNVRVEGSNDSSLKNGILCYQQNTRLPANLELMCLEPMIVQHVHITASVSYQILELCEVEIYGGRYVSYKGTVTQSSYFNGWPLSKAAAAVDGRPMLEGDMQENAASRTCAVTNFGLNESWKLTFSNEMLLQGIHVYGRRLPNNPGRNGQLAGFVVHTLPQNGNVSLIYMDNLKSHWTDYQPRVIELAMPRTSLGVLIYNNPKTKDRLSLCEVEVFAECQHGRCGWNCSDVCHCATITTGAYRKYGICPHGCQHRWRGQNGRCDSTCQNNTWGPNCSRFCFCSPGSQCNIENGTCLGDCAAGWKGPSCNTTCDNHMYGPNCKKSCGKCADHIPCNVTTGHCHGACEPGFQGNLCDEQCKNFAYGPGCTELCGSCFNSTPCNKVNGHCDSCDLGYKGDRCLQNCTEREYGYDCNETCGHCKDNESCNTFDGHCPGDCEPGWQEPLCKDECTALFYGERCNGSCGNCLNSQPCDKVTGHCISCAAGFAGNFCTENCTEGEYGYDCNETCGHCRDNKSCNSFDGYCPGDCEPGWQGPLCKDECDDSFYGEGCNNSCGHCNKSAPCDKVTGQCNSCAAGFEGNFCMEESALRNSEDTDVSAGAIVGIIIGLLVAAAIGVGIIILFRRRPRLLKEPALVFRRRSSDETLYPQDFLKTDMPHLSMANTKKHSLDGTDDGPVYTNRALPSTHIDLSELKTYCQKIKLDPAQLFEDFKKLPYGRQFDMKKAQRECNMSKNRYKDIYPYDKNIVVLPLESGIRGSDYISASYIDGFGKQKRYIASQGAMKNTVSDVWRMIWFHDIGTIVMLTRCYELAKLKCEKYWPSEESCQYGDIQVKVLLEDVYAEHVTRTFELKKTGSSEVKHTTQYQFTGWPDKDVPDDTLSLVQFWRIVKHSENAARSPWLVHCSAGIGRTGTFIALDFLYDQGKAENYIDVKECVHGLRDQRVNMVQTKDQYVFLHQAVLEALDPVGRPFHTEEFHDKWNLLTNAINPGSMEELYLEYKAVSDFPEDLLMENEYATFNTFLSKDDFSDSLKPENIEKSRKLDILPPNRYRPKLEWSEEFQNNYINAVFMSTFRMKDGLILNQLPMTDTVIDTLRLIWQFNISTIIVMEATIPKESRYWPVKVKSVHIFGPFAVQLDSEESNCGILTRKMRIYYQDSDDAKEVVQFHYLLWPETTAVPESTGSVLRLVSDAETTLRKTGSSSPLLVQCLDGATRSGLFCIIWSVLERIKSDSTVAIADTVRLAMVRRKQIIPNYEQYRFCWEAVRDYIESDDVYGNVI